MAGYIIVELQGDYDITRRDELDNVLDRYGDADDLAFDLQAVGTLDSSAVRSLVRFQRARKEAGRPPIVLLKPSRSARRFLEAAELQHTFEIRED